jgi:polyhydroxybutyrate depolymerase
VNRESRFVIRYLLLLAWALSVTASAAGTALAPGDHEFSIAHNALRRSYLVHVPPQATSGQPLPVVINFHGGGGNARVHKSYTRMDAASDRDGYLAVYPNGSGGIGDRFLTWNAGLCCGLAVASGVDDVSFTLAVLEDLARRIPLDRARVYATGLSNGAMMAYRLAVESSRRIAAIAGVAGAMSLQRFAPSSTMPVMHIHSVDDGRALYGGGLGPAFPFADTRAFHHSVDSTLGKWVTHNGCSAEPRVEATVNGAPGSPDAGHTAIRYIHDSCRDGAEVVLWKLTGAGHVWPGGIRDYLPALLGAGTSVIDANAELWRFFSRFRRAPR